ncbi:MAG: ATP-dependent DNA helicase [Acidobacteriota bacterium]|nr:ATP-dependent DNA helicase [Blastocatellia bacterium]MDW8413450.1 ATP-dependent DNA helicase [Acidobacteriota bacterium]
MMESVFGPSGILAKSHPSYEYRPGQLQMAEAVLSIFKNGGVLLCEAGTGTGKTLAYLLPAVALGRRVIVSTATMALQEQLYYKDIPFIEQMLERKLQVACLKGRTNYLCLYKLKKAETSAVLRDLNEVDYFEQVRRWARQTKTGDKAELQELPEKLGFWQDIDARSERCLGQKCPEFETCFVTRARQQAQQADIVIVNHHLFFADLALRNDEYSPIIPEYFAVVLDEAHEIEDVVSEHFGIEVSSFDSYALLQEVSKLEIKDSRATSEITKISDELAVVFENFWTAFGEHRTSEGRHMLMPALDSSTTESRSAYLNSVSLLERLAKCLQMLQEPSPETELMAKRCGNFASKLRFIMEEVDDSYVCWYERKGRRVVLRAAPIDISQILSQNLFEKVRAVVLTSATLASGEDFSFIKARLGVTGQELKIRSHFDYSKQAILYLPASMPDPKSSAYAQAVAKEVLELLAISKGRAFVLFTSVQQMNHVYELVKDQLSYPLFVQGQASKSVLLERFRTSDRGVLFAVASFWQGVDVQGEALSCVIIDRLPFAVPTDPIVFARCRSIEARGEDPFLSYSLPQAIMTLRQGIGRLIRSSRDRGAIAILDPRIRTKSYGRLFLQNLPSIPITTCKEDVARFFDDVDSEIARS